MNGNQARTRWKSFRFVTWRSALLLLLFGSLLLATTVFAVNGFSVAWWSVDAGGGEAAGGAYTIQGTIGQSEAAQGSAGGPYTVSGGVWGRAVDPRSNSSYQVLIPFLRN